MTAAARQIAARTIVGGILAVVVVAAMAWLAGAFHRGKIVPGQAALPPQAIAGPVVKVVRVESPREAEVVGSVQSETRTGISSRIVANILQMRVNAGDRVRKGDVLVTLDDAAPKARVEQARETLRAAQASRDLAETELNRLTPLLKSNAVSQQTLDEWRMKLAVATADVARANQAIREAEVGRGDAQLSAPFDGVVIDRSAEPGEQASPGRPLLTIYDPSRLRLEASVPESYVGRLSAGQKLAVFIEAISQERPGVVEQIVPASDPNSRSFLVKVHLDNPAGLYPGMYGRVRVPLGTEQRIEIPQSAVSEVGQLSLVNVVSDGRQERRAVRLGQPDGANVEVLSGLREGEQVVSD